MTPRSPAQFEALRADAQDRLERAALRVFARAGYAGASVRDVAREAGVDGVVCSGEEVAAFHKLWPKGFFVVPGVRLANGEAGDQKRVVTPRAALDAGASILVVGRPITNADDPDAAARAIGATL